MAERERLDLTVNDTGPTLEFHVVRHHPTAGPTAVDLTGASLTWLMRAPSGALVSRGATAPGVSGASAGHAFLFWGPSGTDLATAGQYDGQLVCAVPSSAVHPGGFVQTAPPEKPFLVVVHARV